MVARLFQGVTILHPHLGWSCFLATINYDGFPMVLTPLDHHHFMFLEGPTIIFNGFSMVFGLATIAFDILMVLDHSSDDVTVSINRNLQCSNF